MRNDASAGKLQLYGSTLSIVYVSRNSNDPSFGGGTLLPKTLKTTKEWIVERKKSIPPSKKHHPNSSTTQRKMAPTTSSSSPTSAAAPKKTVARIRRGMQYLYVQVHLVPQYFTCKLFWHVHQQFSTYKNTNQSSSFDTTTETTSTCTNSTSSRVHAQPHQTGILYLPPLLVHVVRRNE